ncbi:MAG: hypothetical protein HQ512_01555 [Rhodospirillales bacterium]|nr:hypothetical protein [Rhodospirillales bacterium]
MSKGNEATYIQPTTSLRDKVSSKQSVGSPTAEMERVIDQMLPEYELRALKDIDGLTALHAALARDPFNEELCAR